MTVSATSDGNGHAQTPWRAGSVRLASISQMPSDARRRATTVMSRMAHRTLLTAGLLGICFTVTSCAKPLDASSSCADFLRATIQERDSAVKDIALSLSIKGAGSPLVLPNVEYLCGNSPSAKLGTAVQHSAS